MALINKETVAFIEAVAHLKKHHGVMQNAIERSLGMAENTISHMKKGKRMIKYHEFKKLVQLYPDVSSYFQGDKNEPSPPQVVNEPPTEYKKTDMFQYLLNSSIKANEALIELQAAEIERLKEEVARLEKKLKNPK